MANQLRRVPSLGGLVRLCGILLGLLLSAPTGQRAFAGETGQEPAAAPPQQQQPFVESTQENTQGDDHQSKPSPALDAGAPAKPTNICDALAAVAAANALRANFFIRLIWQESRFAPDAISRKGAQGIAQFMPDTARSNGLENPFDPFQAIEKSGRLLSDLRREFGNLGLAAAAYNAGPGRVRDWLNGRRLLPRETRAYVWIVTGRSAEAWRGGEQAIDAKMPSTDAIRCDGAAATLIQASTAASANRDNVGNDIKKPDIKKPDIRKPWGVEIVGGTTPETALARYRDWRLRFAAIVADREPSVVIRGIVGQAGAARVRIGEDSRTGAERLCASLRSAGTYCDVMRN